MTAEQLTHRPPRQHRLYIGDIRKALWLVELARVMAHATAEAREQFPRLALDDLDLRTVLIDHVDQALCGIGREVERDGGATARP